MGEKKTKIIPANRTLPMIAMRGLVLYPNMVLHFDIGREKSIAALNESAASEERLIFLTAQKDIEVDEPKISDLYQVGVVAQIKQIIKIPKGGLRVMVEGCYRAKITVPMQDTPYFMAKTKSIPLKRKPANSADMEIALIRAVKNLFEDYSDLSPKMPKEIMLGVMMAEDANVLAEFIAGNIPVSVEEKQTILEQSDVLKRLEYVAQVLESESEILALERDIYDKVKERMDQNQREYYLREQIKVLSEEIDGEDSPQTEVEEYLNKIAGLNLTIEACEKLTKEANRLTKMPSSSQEASVIRNYLDTCIELPWNVSNVISSDVKKAQHILDNDHYGLEKVKERIVESIAVRALAPKIKGQILCLVGPPGVGKTSIGKSIAKATGREYVRISLGGVKDESDIRGHRKTYIGSMPGRIIDAMKRAKSKNPLMLLDEIDKLGADFKGDPTSALLEVLDAEQNSAFRDHYIEIPFDLSDVLFVATANDDSNIPGPLYDRMEVIDIPSYTREEKYNIAKKYLIPKQRERHGLKGTQIRISDDGIYTLIDSYTREAGVRKLEQTTAKVMRKTAKMIVAEEKKRVVITPANVEEFLGPKRRKIDGISLTNEVGVVNGLAWTSVGGETMPIEVAVLDGTGKLELTGSLGDVMKESAQAAVSYIRSKCDVYGIEKEFYKTRDIHIHVPEGAVPKDGPSAGTAICTALISALTGISVKRDVAMTGEITLRGRVLPIGGLREKTMAAYRAGVKTVIVPADNEADISELSDVIKENINFVIARNIEIVLETALTEPFKIAEVQSFSGNIDKETPTVTAVTC